MSPSKTGLVKFGNAILYANTRGKKFMCPKTNLQMPHCSYYSPNKVAGGLSFSTVSDRKDKYGTTPEDFIDKESNMPGYGGSGVGSGVSSHGSKKERTPSDGGGDKGASRRPEDMDMEHKARGAVANAKSGVVAAMDTGTVLGEMAKQAMDGMLDAAKRTTESVKESASGGSEEEPKRTEQRPDAHVAGGLQRGAGAGNDLKADEHVDRR